MVRAVGILRALALPLAGAAVIGCAGDLPIAERIVSTRPLALRIEVVDPTADASLAVRDEALPLETIDILPLFADPDGVLSDARIEADIEPVWLACPMQPIEGVFGCISSRFPLELADIEPCPTFDLANFDPADPSFPTVPAPCRIAGGTAARPRVQVPVHPNLLLGGDLEITMIGHVPGENTTADCAEALLSQAGSLPETCIFQSRRASVGPDTQILELAESFGIEGLGGLDLQPPETPDADRNPRIATFTVAVVDEGEVLRTVEVSRGDLIEVAAGNALEIVTTASPDDRQVYYIPQDSTTFEETHEFFLGSWYRTWGDLLSPDSDDPTSKNTWTMVPGEQDDQDAELPPDGRATLVYVLRDSRQGVDWWWFSVQVVAG